MEQLTDLSDSRNKGSCIHCGTGLWSEESSRDHVPTKGLLNPPYPENLPVVEVCQQCNSSFSSDEEYLIAFLGSALSGSTRPDPDRFPKAAGILTRSPLLANRINRSRTVQTKLWGDTEIRWKPERDRIERVMVKNARGHVFYEIGQPMLEQPSQVSVYPIQAMTAQQIDQFEHIPPLTVAPEVGSRMMQRILVAVPLSGYYFGDALDGWLHVQDDVYRYTVVQKSGQVLVRTVIYEYLASEVTWDY